MESFRLSFEYSPWWILAILLVASSLSWVMYSGKNSWNAKQKWVLGALRFLAIFLVLLLLLNPQLTSISSYKEKPLFPILVDNSQSSVLTIHTEKELKGLISKVKDKIESKGFNPVMFVHDNALTNLDSISFRHPSSDITGLIRNADAHLAKHGHMILISDGIYNAGVSPTYQRYKSNIYTLGIGDTIPRKDVLVKSLQNNAVAFLGNKFMLRAELHAIGYTGETMEVSLKGPKGTIEKQAVKIDKNFSINRLDFLVLATEKGFQRYTVEISPLKGESNAFNNKLNAYVDVVDDRENILIVSPAPHPNIKAIRSSLANVENTHLEIFIPGVSTPKESVYDLVILHNCLLQTLPEAQKYVKENTSLFYITGTQTNFGQFNQENGIVEVISQNQTDQVQGSLNQNFNRFKLKENLDATLGSLPPVEVTFGEVRAKAGTEVLLFQKVSGIQTAKPLLLFGKSKRRTGVFLTEGFWLWKMYEAQEKEKSETTEELIVKTIQYLSSKEDKRKFRIYPHQKEYYEGEQVRIEAELYNDLYEKIYGTKIAFQISGNNYNKTFDFQLTESNTALQVATLKPGVYKVQATTRQGGQDLKAQAEFLIKERQLENIDLKANHQLLKELSKKNGGLYYPIQRTTELLNHIDQLEATAIWKSKENSRRLIDEKWYFFLIFALLSIEWIMRRYTGSY